MNQKSLIIPKSLHPGSRIGIVAPAGPFDTDRFAAGIEALEKSGLTPVIPNGLTKRKNYLAGSDRHRAKMFEKMFCDPTIDGVWCARGGYGAMRLLPLLDYDRIHQNPKVLIGFSDITALLVTLYERCQLVTYHGPVITSLGDGSIPTQNALADAVTSSSGLVIESRKPLVLRPGKAVGPVIGGNLTILSHLMGTPFAPSYAGRILFIEDCDEKPYRIDRILTQMRLSGCLDRIVGLILGRFTNCGAWSLIEEIVRDCFRKQDIPILGGFDIGHGKINLTLPVGLTAELNTASAHLTYLQPAVI